MVPNGFYGSQWVLWGGSGCNGVAVGAMGSQCVAWAALTQPIFAVGAAESVAVIIPTPEETDGAVEALLEHLWGWGGTRVYTRVHTRVHTYAPTETRGSVGGVGGVGSPPGGDTRRHTRVQAHTQVLR